MPTAWTRPTNSTPANNQTITSDQACSLHLYPAITPWRLTLINRVIAPICQYAAVNGRADWHLMHWGNLLNGGAGLPPSVLACCPRPYFRMPGPWDDATEAAMGDTLHRAAHWRRPHRCVSSSRMPGARRPARHPGMAVSSSLTRWVGGRPLVHLPCRICPMKRHPRQ